MSVAADVAQWPVAAGGPRGRFPYMATWLRADTHSLSVEIVGESERSTEGSEIRETKNDGKEEHERGKNNKPAKKRKENCEKPDRNREKTNKKKERK
jgi:hypothetical protein